MEDTEKNNKIKGKNRFVKRLIGLIALIGAAIYVCVSPRWFSDGLHEDRYRQWLQRDAGRAAVIIDVWHIADFRPYVGSLGNWLKQRAEQYSKGYAGVYFNVSSYSPEDALEQLSRGSRPDVISISGDTFAGKAFRTFVREIEKTYALPYCASGSFLVYDPTAALNAELSSLAESAGTPDEFRRGKTASCICDIRGTGDLYRAELMGKCPYFEAEPIEGTLKYQYLALFVGIDEKKLPYAAGFIEYALSIKAQSTLSAIGLIPADNTAKTDFEQEWLRKLYELSITQTPPPL